MVGETAPLFNVAFDGVKLIGIMVAMLLIGPFILKPVLSRFKPAVRLILIAIVLVICISYLLLHKRAKEHRTGVMKMQSQNQLLNG